MNQSLRIGVFAVLGCIVLISIGAGIYLGSTSENSQNSPDTSQCGYNNCHPLASEKLNVHVVPHTHDDAGWLKTVDTYYVDQVKYIINAVVNELEYNPDRRFIYVEVAFLSRWWKQAPLFMQDKMKRLVQNGQLQFTLGHWTMPDEAITHYEDLITNAKLGMRFLEEVFGECGRPLVAWQIDPFGHSDGVRDLFQKMGYDAVFLGRVDDPVFEKRKNESKMEFYWGRNPKSELLTIINPSMYGVPYKYCWDSYCDSWDNTGNPEDKWGFHRPDQFIQDDPELENYNVDERMTGIYDHIKAKHLGYTTNNFLMTMGGDFHFANANQYYDNIDKMIKLGNEMYGSEMNFIYSTPACYAKAVKDSGKVEQEKYTEGDFFPYCNAYDEEVKSGELKLKTFFYFFNLLLFLDFYFNLFLSIAAVLKETSFWSGYYASRSQLKADIRGNASFLATCNLLENAGIVSSEATKPLRTVVALTQHHDGITGTEKQHVVDDYNRRLKLAENACLGEIDSQLTQKNEKITVINSLSFDRAENIDGENIVIPGYGWVVLDKKVGHKIENDDFNKFEKITSTGTPYVLHNDDIGVTIDVDKFITSIKVTNIRTNQEIQTFEHSWKYYLADPGCDYPKCEKTPKIPKNFEKFQKRSEKLLFEFFTFFHTEIPLH